MSMPQPAYGHGHGRPATSDTGNLADILERVLDRGVVIAGDIRVNLLDIELLTIKLRLVVASVDTAREMGIDWWEHDPFLGGRSRPSVGSGADAGRSDRALPDRTDRRTEEEER
ncbi:gas vesicle protein [Micromonosporaceae bacterium B7E4]